MSRRLLPLFLTLLLAVACQTDEATDAPAPSAPAATSRVPATAEATPSPVATVAAEKPTMSTATATPLPVAPTATGAAANADVTFVRAVQAADGSWTFHVTVEHPDTGWEDYADGWDVVTAEGEVLRRAAEDQFTRLLLHPHVDEQPFTRSQSSLILPADAEMVTVRAHDLVDGFGGREVVVDLTATSGPDFEVERGAE